MTRWALDDIDRCPHGRHQGDACAGWRGPGKFDGGCLDGVSLGNPWWQRLGTRAGTTLYGDPVMTAVVTDIATPPPCQWAPVSHSAPGRFVVTVARPCGCSTADVASCRDHFMWARGNPTAGRPTECLGCGVVAPLAVVADRLWSS